MAFPVTSLLDDFERADALPIGGNWTPRALNYETQDCELKNSKFASYYAGTAYWNVATFGPDTEVWAQLFSGTGSLLARITDPGAATGNGYRIVFAKNAGPGAGTVKFYSYLDGTATNLELDIGELTFADDDWVGVEVLNEGSDVRFNAYRKPAAGSWGLLGTSLQTTGNKWTGAGYIGLYDNDRGYMDNFGGGNISTSVDYPFSSAADALVATGTVPRLDLAYLRTHGVITVG